MKKIIHNTSMILSVLFTAALLFAACSSPFAPPATSTEEGTLRVSFGVADGRTFFPQTVTVSGYELTVISNSGELVYNANLADGDDALISLSQGNYTVSAAALNANGTIAEGSITVEVYSGQVATANLVLQPVLDSNEAGTLTFNVTFPNEDYISAAKLSLTPLFENSENDPLAAQFFDLYESNTGSLDLPAGVYELRVDFANTRSIGSGLNGSYDLDVSRVYNVYLYPGHTTAVALEFTDADFDGYIYLAGTITIRNYVDGTINSAYQPTALNILNISSASSSYSFTQAHGAPNATFTNITPNANGSYSWNAKILSHYQTDGNRNNVYLSVVAANGTNQIYSKVYPVTIGNSKHGRDDIALVIETYTLNYDSTQNENATVAFNNVVAREGYTKVNITNPSGWGLIAKDINITAPLAAASSAQYSVTSVVNYNTDIVADTGSGVNTVTIPVPYPATSYEDLELNIRFFALRGSITFNQPSVIGSAAATGYTPGAITAYELDADNTPRTIASGTITGATTSGGNYTLSVPAGYVWKRSDYQYNIDIGFTPGNADTTTGYPAYTAPKIAVASFEGRATTAGIGLFPTTGLTPVNATLSGTTVQVEWTPVPWATTYRLYVNGTPPTNSLVTGTSTSYSLQSPTSASTYEFRIVPLVNTNGTHEHNTFSATSNTVTYYTSLNPVSNFVLTASTTANIGQVEMSWGTVTGATLYRLQVSINGEAWEDLQANNSTNYTHANLTNVYTRYRVRAERTADGAVTTWNTGNTFTGFPTGETTYYAPYN